MAHEIGEMFWYGDVPWHGLGRQATKPLTLDEALAQGGLDWTVKLVAIATADGPSSPAPHRMAVVREDRAPEHSECVVGVVHPGFRPLQNREGGELFDRLFDPGTRKYHTGGYLKSGEVVGLLARLPEEVRIGGDDVVETYLRYSNSHDGSQPIDIRLTTIRVVCHNMLSFALNGHTALAFRRRHRDAPEVVEREAKSFLQLTIAQLRDQKKRFRALAARRCDHAPFAPFSRSCCRTPRRRGLLILRVKSSGPGKLAARMSPMHVPRSRASAARTSLARHSGRSTDVVERG